MLSHNIVSVDIKLFHSILREFFLSQVVTYDAVNHGKSSHHAQMTYHDLAADLFHLMDQLEIPKAILIGEHPFFLFLV